MSQCLKKNFGCNTIKSPEKDAYRKKLIRNRGYWYCFTLNNHDENILVSLSQGKFGNLQIEKLVCQEEIGENKTPHIQGVVKFKNQTEFSSVKKNMPKAHIENTKNIAASIKYCSKLDTRYGERITFGDVNKLLPKKKLRESDYARFFRDHLRSKGYSVPIKYPPVKYL